MPTPPFTIVQHNKGISDFSIDLIQFPYPTETFEADKDGMFQVIPALAERARQSDVQPLLTPSIIAVEYASAALPPSTWTTLSFDSIANYGNEFTTTLNNTFTLTQVTSAYFRVNMKVVIGGLALGDTVLLRWLLNGGTAIAQNQATTSGSAQIELFLDKKYLLYLNDYSLFQVYTEAIGATIDGMTDVSNDNYLEISR